MGAVYVAEQISTERHCALKVMQPDLVDHPEARKRFLREARIGALLKSDFVVKVLQAGIDEVTGMPWLAMELLEGQDLETYVLGRGNLNSSEVVEILDQLCDALGEAHAKGIVHRDIKPENIFLAAPRRRRDRFAVKVLDFGIARMLAEAQTTSSRTQRAIGTPLFMAPEQAQPGFSIGPFTDVWALGLVTFWLLTGHHYWRTASDPNATVVMLAMEAYMQPMPLASTRAAEWECETCLPLGFDGWFARCLARDSKERFPDAGEAFAAFERIAPPLPKESQSNTARTPSPFASTEAALGHARPVAGKTEPGAAAPSGIASPRAVAPPAAGVAHTVGAGPTRKGFPHFKSLGVVALVLGGGLTVAFLMSTPRPPSATSSVPSTTTTTTSSAIASADRIVTPLASSTAMPEPSEAPSASVSELATSASATAPKLWGRIPSAAPTRSGAAPTSEPSGNTTTSHTCDDDFDCPGNRICRDGVCER